ncbi:hypothetical protein TNCV_3470201 [Trichonephila clavipes]|nr:hypothetical protein TNCV_3470201 [Trichonephila clavipes]
MNGMWCSRLYERKFRLISRLCMVIVDTRVGDVRVMVNNDESDAVTTHLTINLSILSAVALGRPLPS